MNSRKQQIDQQIITCRSHNGVPLTIVVAKSKNGGISIRHLQFKFHRKLVNRLKLIEKHREVLRTPLNIQVQ